MSGAINLQKQIRELYRLALPVVLLLCFAFPAHADCTNPAGTASEITYSRDFMVNQYCDGTNWVSMGVSTLGKGLVGHWRLDETSGTNVVDSIGGNDGTWSGSAVVASSAGMFVNAMNFDGVDDLITAGSGANIDNIFAGGGTATAWIRPEGWGESNLGYIASKSAAAGTNGWLFFLDNVYANTPSLRLVKYFSGGAGAWNSPVNSLSLNEWNHVAVVYDDSNAANDPIFYINGVSVAVTESTSTSGTPVSDASENFTIGNRGNMDRTFNGQIDDVRVYNRVLSAAEVSSLYNMGLSNGLVAYWKLDETSGTTAYDAVGTNDGAMVGGLDASTDSASGKVNTALNFDGVDDYVNTGQNLFSTHQTGTITAWIKIGNINNNNVIYSLQQSHGYRGNAFYVNSSGELSFWKRNSSTNDIAKGNTVLSAQKWYHVAISSNGSNYKMYVDGVDEGALTGSDNGYWFGDNGSQPHDYFVGKISRSGTALDGWFDGYIDDVRVYNRVLSATEIANLARKCSNPHGLAGKIVYNDDSDVMQYCDGEKWIAMGPVPGASADTGCTAPARSNGALVYNSSSRFYQYCDGVNWIQVGEAGPVAPTTGLLAYWKLDESAGTTAVDSVGGYDGTLTGMTPATDWLPTGGQYKGTLDFDGVNDYVNIGSFNLSGYTGLSVCAWLKYAPASVTADGVLFADWTNGGADGVMLWVDDVANYSGRTDTISFMVDLVAGGRVEGSSNLVTSGTWDHYCGVFKGSSFMRLYKNGILDMENTTSIVAASTNGNPAWLGSCQSCTSRELNGQLDDVRVYDRALSAQEVRDLYLATGGM